MLEWNNGKVDVAKRKFRPSNRSAFNEKDLKSRKPFSKKFKLIFKIRINDFVPCDLITKTDSVELPLHLRIPFAIFLSLQLCPRAPYTLH